jgi:hypothetical protein
MTLLRMDNVLLFTPRAIRSEPDDAPVNTLGYRRVMFTVDDVDAVVVRLQRQGAELVGDVVRYEDAYRLCYLRGPRGLWSSLPSRLAEPAPAPRAPCAPWQVRRLGPRGLKPASMQQLHHSAPMGAF